MIEYIKLGGGSKMAP